MHAHSLTCFSASNVYIDAFCSCGCINNPTLRLQVYVYLRRFPYTFMLLGIGDSEHGTYSAVSYKPRTT